MESQELQNQRCMGGVMILIVKFYIIMSHINVMSVYNINHMHVKTRQSSKYMHFCNLWVLKFDL